MGTILRGSVEILPALGFFILTILYHGTPEVAESVNRSWIPLWRAIEPRAVHLETPAAAIQALGWTTEQGLSLGINLLTSGFYQPMAWATLFAVSFFLVVLFTGQRATLDPSASRDARMKVTAILVAQFVFISPFFILGFDYGRWLFLWITSSLIIHTSHREAPRWLQSCVSRCFEVTRMDSLVVHVPAKDWYLLFFGIPVCWNIHNFIFSSPVIRHLHIISSWF